MCYYLRQPHSISPLNRRAMVGKLHPSSLRISDKPSLCSGDEPSPLPNAGHGGNRLHAGPSVPQKVVIGFDIGPEIRIPDVCDSPRSVLESYALSPPGETQALTRSCLGALFPVTKGSQGVGLALIAHIQSEEDCKKGALVEVHPQQESPPISIMSSGDGPSFAKRGSKYAYGENVDICPGYSNHTELVLTDCFDDEMHPWLGSVHSPLIWEDTEDQDNNDKGYEDSRINHKSIFAVGSAPSYCSSDIRYMASFDACVSCRCAFVTGEDIFMYRGDQAFCSVECRARQIEVDEYMEQQARLAAPNHSNGFSVA